MIDLSKIRHVHFVGVGGIMMSGIAEILKNESYIVSGSDRSRSKMTDHLTSKGIKVYIGHNGDNVKGADLVVYSSAVPADNVELLKAKEEEIPILNRAEMIGYLMPQYNTSVAIAGAHGKTTTTSMVSTIMDASEHNPTILVGGIVSNLGSNVQLGDSSMLLLEACEYKENFLHFNHNIGVILNIDEDHLDYFDDLEHIIQAFIKFAKKIPETGALIINNDDYNAKKVKSHVDCNVITFGINTEAEFQGRNITFNEKGYSKFDIYHGNDLFGTFLLKQPGKHNIYNAIAAIVTAHTLGVPVETMTEAIKDFGGAVRRFEVLGKYNEATVVDDYAHHPNEIKAALQAAKKFPNNKVTCIFQPHTYTRTNDLLLQFASAFNEADSVIITDIYAAREENIYNIHAKDLVAEIAEENDKVKYIESFDEIVEFIKATARPDNLIITMGAGNIREVGERIIK
ncbi:UDP-N-acetylmuramate--L-alanine ligase [Acidaminobacter sp. JC074]|uniref:UDP-N-acetylmuramate--L-alanine ligase n=1 Tax=Acidaminobacter sp. JC074 TaxID=2530199 RepID=UPI001F0F0132|nr:UDP-N-acetylmuramate--L-alanine ligase [Acidaminobacter sp. JC074]MCH4890629.1 UDP-N-acetylmuramate--L-alanine ligase [Acidaminobacter sp. JC074]